MFIVKDTVDDSSSVRSAMLTFHPYGAGISFFSFNYKHFVPDGTFHRCVEFASHHSSAQVFRQLASRRIRSVGTVLALQQKGIRDVIDA